MPCRQGISMHDIDLIPQYTLQGFIPIEAGFLELTNCDHQLRMHVSLFYCHNCLMAAHYTSMA